MTRSGIIGAVAAVVIVGGGAAYLATKEDNNGAQNTSQQSSGNSTAGEGTFAPVSTKGLAFEATISTAGGPSEISEAKLEYDGKDKTRYSAIVNGNTTQFIYTTDAYYSCADNECLKFPNTQSGTSGFNPSDYEYDEAKIADRKDKSTYKGKKDCPAGTCDVYEVNVDSAVSTFYIDTKTKRISQVEGTVSGVTSKIVYNYKNINIEVPANAKELPIGQ